MRYSPDHKEKTRERILEAAAKVFRRLGYEGAGVDAVMAEAGLTAGGFYAHFRSKEALLAEALVFAMKNTTTLVGAFDQLAGAEWAHAVAERYLNMAHRAQLERGCPLPLLLAEVARSGKASKQSFETMFRRLLEHASSRLEESTGRSAEDQAMAFVALLVGGMTISRALADDELAERVLSACREFLQQGLCATPSSPATTSEKSTSPRSKSRHPTRKGKKR